MRPILLFLSLVVAAGCTMTQEQRTARELSLKSNADNFIQRVIQEDWAGAYAMTASKLAGPDDFKEYMMQTWVPEAVITGGSISSMAWVTDRITKTKINWKFQSGTVSSYSSETFLWEWTNDAWKWKGRVAR